MRSKQDEDYVAFEIRHNATYRARVKLFFVCRFFSLTETLGPTDNSN